MSEDQLFGIPFSVIGRLRTAVLNHHPVDEPMTWADVEWWATEESLTFSQGFQQGVESQDKRWQECLASLTKAFSPPT